MNRAPVNFLSHIYDESIVDLANILDADARDDKATIRIYLTMVKEQIDKWIKEL